MLFFTKNENTVKRNNSCCEGTKKRLLAEIEKHIDHILVKLNDSESSSERKWKTMSGFFRELAPSRGKTSFNKRERNFEGKQ